MLIRHINFISDLPNPAPPSEQNYFGTDDRGRDVLARVVYGFLISVPFEQKHEGVGEVVFPL